MSATTNLKPNATDPNGRVDRPSRTLDELEAAIFFLQSKTEQLIDLRDALLFVKITSPADTALMQMVRKEMHRQVDEFEPSGR